MKTVNYFKFFLTSGLMNPLHDNLQFFFVPALVSCWRIQLHFFFNAQLHPRQLVIGQEEMTSGCVRGGSGWISGKISSLNEWLCTGRGCPGKQWNHHSWVFSKMRGHGTLWYNLVGLVALGQTLDLMILEVFSSPYDSVITYSLQQFRFR